MTPNDDDIGSQTLYETIKRIKPLVHVFGHCHYGYGKLKDGKTVYVNAAIIDKKYKTANSPIIFDII